MIFSEVVAFSGWFIWKFYLFK